MTYHQRIPEVKVKDRDSFTCRVSLPEAQRAANLPSIYSDVWTAQASLSSIQGWPISFGVQSLLLFLAPFEIGYSEGQISSYPAEFFSTELLSLFYRLDWLRWILFMLFWLFYPTWISHWYLDWCLQQRKVFSDHSTRLNINNTEQNLSIFILLVFNGDMKADKIVPDIASEPPRNTPKYYLSDEFLWYCTVTPPPLDVHLRAYQGINCSFLVRVKSTRWCCNKRKCWWSLYLKWGCAQVIF